MSSRQDREERDPLDAALRAAFPETALPAEIRQALTAELHAARADWLELPARSFAPPSASRRLWWAALAASVALVAFGGVLFQAYRPSPPTPAPVVATTSPVNPKTNGPTFLPIDIEMDYCMAEFEVKDDFSSHQVKRRLAHINAEGQISIVIAYNRSKLQP